MVKLFVEILTKAFLNVQKNFASLLQYYGNIEAANVLMAYKISLRFMKTNAYSVGISDYGK